MLLAGSGTGFCVVVAEDSSVCAGLLSGHASLAADELHSHRVQPVTSFPVCYEPDQQQCAFLHSHPSYPASSAPFDETKHVLPEGKSQVKGNPCIAFGTDVAVKDGL